MRGDTGGQWNNSIHAKLFRHLFWFDGLGRYAVPVQVRFTSNCLILDEKNVLRSLY